MGLDSQVSVVHYQSINSGTPEADMDKMTTEQLKQTQANAQQAVWAGEKAGLGDKHPKMRAAYRVLGAASAALASR